MPASKTPLEQLQEFRNRLYPHLFLAMQVKKPIQPNEDDSKYRKRWSRDWSEFYASRQQLLETYGRLVGTIEANAKRPTVIRMRGRSQTPLDAGAVAFGMNSLKDVPAMEVAINQIHDQVTLAIGALSSEAIRSSAENESAEKPRVFISQAGPSCALDKLSRFLQALGLEAVIVQDRPSEGRSVARNIDLYLDKCDCAIILATKGDIDARTKKRTPRANISHEMGKCEEIFPGKVIYLKEKGAQFSSNTSERVWESFAPNHMDRALIKVALELSAFGLLRCVKPDDA
jgi:hypothetical protein